MKVIDHKNASHQQKSKNHVIHQNIQVRGIIIKKEVAIFSGQYPKIYIQMKTWCPFSLEFGIR